MVGVRNVPRIQTSLRPLPSRGNIELETRTGHQRRSKHGQMREARPELVRRSNVSEVDGSAPVARRRKITGPCGRNPHGTTVGWPNPCPYCEEGSSHDGKRLCFACHSPTTFDGDGKELWRHIQERDLAAAKAFWLNMKDRPSVVSRIKSGFEPGVECLCYGPDWFYKWFKLYARLEATEKEMHTCEM